VAFSSQIDGEALYYQNYGEEDLQREMQDPIAFAAKTSDPDTFHYGIAMKQPDHAEFIKAMKEEVNAQTENGHWELLPRSQVPEGVKFLTPCGLSVASAESLLKKYTSGKLASTSTVDSRRRASTSGRRMRRLFNGSRFESS
jgi:hypothetical protein